MVWGLGWGLLRSSGYTKDAITSGKCVGEVRDFKQLNTLDPKP